MEFIGKISFYDDDMWYIGQYKNKHIFRIYPSEQYSLFSGYYTHFMIEFKKTGSIIIQYYNNKFQKNEYELFEYPINGYIIGDDDILINSEVNMMMNYLIPKIREQRLNKILN